MKTNLDLARECGADPITYRLGDKRYVSGMEFTTDQLDAFANRIRADQAAEIAALQADTAALGPEYEKNREVWVGVIKGKDAEIAAQAARYSELFGTYHEACAEIAVLHQALEAAHGIK